LRSGPSLTKREAHHAIHEAAFTEAEEITRLLRQAALAGDHEQALQLTGVLIEHWQTRTLRHAEAEEQGWYRDVARERPELHVDITQLTRDHDLLRLLLGEIEQIVAIRGWVTGIMERFEAMLLLNAIHSREEEQRLLGGAVRAHEERAAADTVASGAPAPDVFSATDVPLAVAYPDIYRRGVERLGTRGIHPGDLRLMVRSSASGGGGEVRLWAAFGRDFVETLEVSLSDASDPVAVEHAFDAIAGACERAVRSEYYEAMEITEPGAPGSRDKRTRINLTIIKHPEGGAQ